jgi:hypothetical protein
MTSQSRPVLTGVVLPLIIAAFGLIDMHQRPLVSRVRAADAFQLVVCGMCLGIALTGFIEFLRAPRSAPRPND